MLAQAMFMPWRAWPRLLAQKPDAGWLYALFALESLLMRPDASTRALWAIGKRGLSSVMVVVQLAATELVSVMLFVYALAAIAALVLRPKTHDLGELVAVLPWAFAPKVAVSATTTIAWALGLAPALCMRFAGFSAHPGWTLAYHALAYGAVLASLVGFVRARHASAPSEPLRLRFAPSLLLAAAVCALLLRVAFDPARFRPIGRGDSVQSLRFLPLLEGADPLELTFPRERPVVIDFWASWCGPCVEALPEWEALAQERALHADFVSANVDPPGGRRLYTERGYRFAAHFADEATQNRFQIETLPTMMVIDTRGFIRAYWVGASSPETVTRTLAGIAEL